MKLIRFSVISLLLIAGFSLRTLAQSGRSFVSAQHGSDSNTSSNCSLAAPCLTISAAMTVTNAGGEVVALDSGSYGTFIVGKAITVEASPGVYAGVSVTSGNAIEIHAGPTDTVVLRGLTVNNQGASGNGVYSSTVGTLHVERCTFNGFSGSNFASVQFNQSGTLEVKNSTVRNSFFGIEVNPPSGTAYAAVDNVRIEGNLIGLLARQGAKVTVRNSLAAANSSDGFMADSSSSTAAELNLENCTAINNGVAIEADSVSSGPATVRISDCTVTDNSVGLENDGSPATILSRGNNTVAGNSQDTIGTIGSYAVR